MKRLILMGRDSLVTHDARVSAYTERILLVLDDKIIVEEHLDKSKSIQSRKVVVSSAMQELVI